MKTIEKWLAIGVLGIAQLAAVPAIAANDPDAIGQLIKYLDYAAPVQVTVGPSQVCPAIPEMPHRCIPLAHTVNESFALADITEIEVDRGLRSLIDFTMHPIVNVSFRGSTSADPFGYLNLYVTIAIESDVLNDPALINPRTGQPFGGKIDRDVILLTERRSVSGAITSPIVIRPDVGFNQALVSRKQLIETFGLSERDARRFMTGPMKFKLGVRGTATNVHVTSFTLTGRLTSD